MAKPASMDALLSPALAAALASLPPAARPFLVGGCVRDWLLGFTPTDFDVEVFGIEDRALAGALAPHGRLDSVGRSFGVLKLTLRDGQTHDFSLPRRESKTGAGHRGFHVESDPSLTPHDAAARRDFTINAMMWDVQQHRLLDFFDGEADLRAGRLRHTGPAFSDDPLRVLRGMQLAGRFALSADPQTLALCQGIRSRQEELPAERIREEWLKWAVKSARPSAGLAFLKDSGWLEFYPEIAALVGVPQEPEWHPEGDVWTHTLHSLDALTDLPAWAQASPESRAVLMFAVLLHDSAKPLCTRVEERRGVARLVSPGHESEGVPLAESFLLRIRAPREALEKVPRLVASHMSGHETPTPRSVRRLAHRLAPATIAELLAVMTADSHGRPPRPKSTPTAVSALAQLAASIELANAAPRPLLLGRDLVAQGLAPGPPFRAWLEAAFDAQLQGEFHDAAGARAWLASRLEAGWTPQAFTAAPTGTPAGPSDPTPSSRPPAPPA